MAARAIPMTYVSGQLSEDRASLARLLSFACETDFNLNRNFGADIYFAEKEKVYTDDNETGLITEYFCARPVFFVLCSSHVRRHYSESSGAVSCCRNAVRRYA